jgi:hypothetical protein
MTDEPKSLQEAEELLRRRPVLVERDRPRPEVVALWREFRSWDGECTCPPRPNTFMQHFNSANPVDVEMDRQHSAEQAAWEAEHARCAACRERPRLEVELLFALGLKLKPWQTGIGAFPDVVAALDAALSHSESQDQ